MRIAVINGPNLNLLGSREPEIYGSGSWDACEQDLKRRFPNVDFFFHQSNVEGELINLLHQYGVPGPQQVDGIVINAGGYSHTSVAIADAVAAIAVPVIGVHISNVYKREPERHMELIAKSATGGIFGLGMEGYSLAVQWLLLQMG